MGLYCLVIIFHLTKDSDLLFGFGSAGSEEVAFVFSGIWLEKWFASSWLAEIGDAAAHSGIKTVVRTRG